MKRYLREYRPTDGVFERGDLIKKVNTVLEISSSLAAQDHPQWAAGSVMGFARKPVFVPISAATRGSAAGGGGGALQQANTCQHLTSVPH